MLAGRIKRHPCNARDTCGGSRIDDGAPSCCDICRISCFRASHVPRTLTPITRSNSSSLDSWIGPRRVSTPALLIAISIRSKRVVASSITARISASRRTSISMNATSVAPRRFASSATAFPSSAPQSGEAHSRTARSERQHRGPADTRGRTDHEDAAACQIAYRFMRCGLGIHCWDRLCLGLGFRSWAAPACCALRLRHEFRFFALWS